MRMRVEVGVVDGVRFRLSPVECAAADWLVGLIVVFGAL